jgi:hypothetical protein
MGAWKSPTAAPEPDEEPPGVRLESCGLRVFGPTVVAANSVVVVLPKISAPALRSIAIDPASTFGALSAYIGELNEVGMSKIILSEWKYDALLTDHTLGIYNILNSNSDTM